MLIREHNYINRKPIVRVTSDLYYLKKPNDDKLYNEILLEVGEETEIIESDVLLEQGEENVSGEE